MVDSDLTLESWTEVVADPRAIAQLQAAVQQPVHAYLFVGPSGSGKRAAARAFAADVLAESSPNDPDRARRLALAEAHPDFVIVEREGASISADQARETVRLTTRPPLEAERKVLLLTDFHLVDQRAPILLKSIEEPPPSTIFIILAEEITTSLVTIASRCVQVSFSPLSIAAVTAALVSDGLLAEQAALVAEAAAGDLGRARVLAGDEGLAARRESWWTVPDRLDGTGARAAEVADELLEFLNEAAHPLASLQEAEMAELVQQMEVTGERGGRKKVLEERHKRVVRRARTDELRSGLTTLGQRVRQDIADGVRPIEDASVITRVLEAMKALKRNPNERLMLQSLMVELTGFARRT